ncbi:MAG: Hsp70 family protein [Pseudonocardia sp.]
MYQLGLDLGTTRSAVAVHRDGTTRAGPSVASVVYAGADGAFLVGEQARERALAHPARVVGGFVHRVGDPTPLLLGREPVAAEVLAARFVGRFVEPVLAREGGPPERVAVAHPTGWGAHRVESLRAALGGRTEMVPQAVAAVVGHGRDLAPGALVAVYDLGGASFDAAVVRVVPGGATLIAPSEGVERLGGDDVDEAAFAHVRAAVGAHWAELDGADPAVQAAVAALRRECTAAKERLSADTEAAVPVRLPGLAPTEVRLTRAELEEAVRGALLRSVDVLSSALDAAGVAPADLAEVLLVGGSVRIPLVAQLVSAGLGRPVTVADDPEGVVAAGAALWAAGRAAGAGAAGAGVAGAGVAGAAAEAGVAGAAAAAAGGAGAAAGVAGAAAGAGVIGAAAAAGVAGAAAAAGATGSAAGARVAGVGAAAGAVGARVAGGPDGEDGRGPLRPVVARPPKQARAFPTETAAESRLPLFVGLGVLVLTILGALVVLGASRYAGENSAVATTPTAVTPAGQATTTPPRAPASPVAPPSRRSAPVATTTAAPPVSTTVPPTSTAPTTGAPTTSPPPARSGGLDGGQGDQAPADQAPADQDGAGVADGQDGAAPGAGSGGAQEQAARDGDLPGPSTTPLPVP